MSDTLNIPTTIIPEGTRNDLRMCLQQALDYLELGEHDGGWVVCQTINLEMIRELAEAIVCVATSTCQKMMGARHERTNEQNPDTGHAAAARQRSCPRSAAAEL